MPQPSHTIASPTSDCATATKPGLTRAQQRIIANVLSWDTQREVTPDEIEAIALQHDVLWVRLIGNRAIPIALDTFKSIRRQQLEEQARAAAEIDVAHVLKSCSKQQETAQNDQKDDIEIDSDENLTRPTYRVWKDWHFLGSFHQSPVDAMWIAHPTYDRDYCRYNTPDEAQQAIIAAWKRAETVRKSEATYLVRGVPQYDD